MRKVTRQTTLIQVFIKQYRKFHYILRPKLPQLLEAGLHRPKMPFPEFAHSITTLEGTAIRGANILRRIIHAQTESKAQTPSSLMHWQAPKSRGK
jgi:hypothetical protein